MFLDCGSRRLDLARPCVMGILNVTPDSFADGGRYADVAKAVARATRMVEEGAAIIDVGGESTRPGAQPVPAEEELRRVMPVIEALSGRIDAVVSVDTSQPQVMRAAIAAGAGLVNDVRALAMPGALETVASSAAAVCLMHLRGEPRTMQADPSYADVVTEVRAFLARRAEACRAAGIAAERIAVDPGFGFGKTADHNLALLGRLGRLCELGFPVLVGLSRKSLVGRLTGRAVDDRLAGSLALAAIAVLCGASIVRAHDVAATVDAVRVAEAVRRVP
jgi:dihydropteroate synthase